MLSRFLNTIFLFFIATAIQGQQYNKSDFKIYRTKDGLSNNFINAITQDAYGYIWIGSVKGLNRFDGSNFRQFYADSLPESLPEDRVFNLKWINEEELGVLTSAGLHIINTRTLQMRNIVIPAHSINDQTTFNRIFDVAADKKQNLFIITSGGFYHYDQGNLVFRYDTLASDGFGWDLVRVNENILLLSTTNGLYIYDIQKKDLHSPGEKDDPFFHLVAQPKQTFRFTYSDENYFSASYLDQESFVLFDIAKKTKQIIAPPVSASKKFDLNGMLFRLNDSLITIPGERGFYTMRFDRANSSWILDTSIYFGNVYCTALLVDKNNRLWVGTADGLYKQSKPVERVEQTQLPGGGYSLLRTVTGLTVANDKLFVATIADGLYVFDKDSFSISKRVMYPARQTFITQLLKVNEDSVISAGNGFLINTQNLEYKKLEPDKFLQAGYMRVILKDLHNRVYFTKYNVDTLYFKDPWDKSFSAIPLPGLKKIRLPTQMAEDKAGNIWFGGEGVIRLNGQSKKIDLQLDSFPFIKRRNKEISSNMVFDKNGRLYFGVFGNGLMIYDIKNKIFSHLTRSDGLPDNVIKALYLHQNETLWIATENGLASYDLVSKRISSFGVSDGMPTDPNACTALYYDPTDKLLYVAFTPVIVRFDPVKLKKNHIPPSFFVESVDLTGKGSIYHPGEAIKVLYKHNSLTVNLTAINYEDVSQQLFAYRLVKNGNENWQEIGAQNRIFLNDLPVGKHTLQMKVYIRNQSWPDQIKEIILTVRPPFWKTTWFYIAICLVIATLLFYLHRLRIKQFTQKANIDKQLAQTEMKALHSQMNPHFIFNCLNSIREMILNNENEQASLYLSKFARLIRITLDHSSRSFVSLEDTIDYLKRYLEMEHIRKSNFSYNIDVDENLQAAEIFLPPMLIQPFIENAIWHGAIPDKELHLNLKFKRKQDALVCIIDDDGIGIEISLKNKEPELNYQSVGISNIKQRIHVLNEKYNLQSTIEIRDKSTIHANGNTGTIVTLHLPIKTNEPLS